MAGQNSILVLGAGELGLSILTSLASHTPTPRLTVLVRQSTITSADLRNTQKISHVRSLNVSILPCDITSATDSELSALFTPFHTIIAANGATSADSILKTVRAVLAAKTPRFLPWQFGVDYDTVGLGSAEPIWDDQFRTRELLRAQTETRWVVISTGLFMSMMFLPEFGIVDLHAAGGETAVRALGGWENEVTVTAPEDIGKLVTAIVYASPEIRDEVVYVGGECISYLRLADIVERLVSREVRREIWTVEFLEKELSQHPADDMAMYRVAFAKEKGVAWHMERTWNVKNGLGTVGIEEYATRILQSSE
jgi:hypothetical protein